jgi:hypothetical protein
MSSFGPKLRRFPPNLSQMKNLAARDFENALLVSLVPTCSIIHPILYSILTTDQCAITAFSGILKLIPNKSHDEEEASILDCLYVMATFHTLARLRLHTEKTTALLADVTKSLGAVLRKLRDDMKKNFKVMELPRDVQARAREQNRRLQKGGSKRSANSTASKEISLNLSTIKNHLLEHYHSMILEFGTMEGYSTELVSCPVGTSIYMSN